MLQARVTMAASRLHIDPNNGSPSVEYRIENGRLERRTVGAAAQGGVAEAQWQPLTRQQVPSAVMASPVVARWLSSRLGFHSLIRACSQPHSSVTDEGQECCRYTREVVIGEFSPLQRTQPRQEQTYPQRLDYLTPRFKKVTDVLGVLSEI